MNRTKLRLLLTLASILTAVSSFAGTLTLKNPTEGTFLGQNNAIQFSISGARVQVTVTAIVTGPTGTTRIPQTFTPNVNGELDGSIPVNFAEGTPTGEYSITLTATEPNNSYESQSVNVQVDVEKPKFFSFSPNDGSYLSGVVRIRASILESNLKDWRVRVNGQDIPNNTGETPYVAVNWDTSFIERDGNHTISITVRDEANNETTKTLIVTLDRIRPTISISYPRADTRIIPNTNLNVTVDVLDASSSSVDGSGIDVLITDNNGRYLMRVPRLSIAPAGGNTLRWIGKIRYRRGQLPSQFRIIVTAVDRAGNAAVPQQVTVRSR